MYLATVSHYNGPVFLLRQSYPDGTAGFHAHRDIFGLGVTPADHFELVEHDIIIFSDPLLKAVEKYSSADSNSLLEALLYDFFPAAAKDKLDRFLRKSYSPPQPLLEEELREIEKTVHIFDRRRLYYLYYGGLDQSRLFRMHEKLCRKLLKKSRDEREYLFSEMEKALKPGEYRNYVYAIFNLHSHFEQSFATFLPEALPFDDVAEYFIDALCRLNADRMFWRSGDQSDSLHRHLRRYLVMFFDYTPHQRSYADEFIRNFMNSHRTFRWPERKPSVSEENIEKLFSASYSELKAMDNKELTRLFRKKAMELHPDKGGDHDRFVELSEVYTTLMKAKN